MLGGGNGYGNRWEIGLAVAYFWPIEQDDDDEKSVFDEEEYRAFMVQWPLMAEREMPRLLKIARCGSLEIASEYRAVWGKAASERETKEGKYKIWFSQLNI